MKRFFIANSTVLVLLLTVVFSGFLERFAEDGSVPTSVYAASLIFYWALVNLVVWFVACQRNKWPQLILAAFSLLISLTFLEVAARILLPVRTAAKWRHVKSSEFHHIGPANRSMYEGRYDGVDVLIKTNEDGLRTEYSREEFLKHPKRVAVMGDSFIFGLGVQQDQIVTKQLEDILRKRWGEDVAVLNAAFISYSPFLHDNLYRKVVRHYKPHIVVQVLDVNDIGDDIRYAADAHVGESGKVTFPGKDFHPPRFHSALWNLLNVPTQEFVDDALSAPWVILSRLLGVAGVAKGPKDDYYKLNLKIGDTKETNRFFVLRHPLSDTKHYFDASMKNIQQLADQVAADDAQFLLAPSPRYFHWNTDECQENWESFRYKNNEEYAFEYFRYFDEQRERVDFPILDMLTKYQETDEFPLVFNGDAHWNARGHRFAAEVLADLIPAE